MKMYSANYDDPDECIGPGPAEQRDILGSYASTGSTNRALGIEDNVHT